MPSCCRNIWISVMSAVARDITSPVRSSSRRDASRCCRWWCTRDLQVALHVDRGPAADQPAGVVEHEAGHADPDEHGQPRREGLRPTHRVVEDDGLDEGRQAEQATLQDVEHDGGEHGLLAPAEDGAEVADPAPVRGCRPVAAHHEWRRVPYRGPVGRWWRVEWWRCGFSGGDGMSPMLDGTGFLAGSER